MKQLIVTADDVGIDPGMTAGAIEAHLRGIVTACSVVANGRAFDDAVARLRDVPSLESGVHLALVEERSLTGMVLPRSYGSFVPGYLAGRIPAGAIEQELRAQIQRVIDAGLQPTHLNSHQHLHALAGIFGLVLQLAQEFRIGYVRFPADATVRFGRAGFVRGLAVSALTVVARRARAAYPIPPGIRSNDLALGITEAGQLTADDVVQFAGWVDGVAELVTHPGTGVAGYQHWGYSWDRETAALCDPRSRAALAERGIALIAPSGLR